MRLSLRDPKRLLVGFIFVAVALLLLSQLGKYRLGTAIHMGPGYFPLILAIILLTLGMYSIGASFSGQYASGVIKISPGPLIFVTLGVVIFSVLIERAGLVAATAALVALICYDRLRRHTVEVALLFVGIATLTNILFILLLGLPLAAF